jgi:hypothetical protein
MKWRSPDCWKRWRDQGITGMVVRGWEIVCDVREKPGLAKPGLDRGTPKIGLDRGTPKIGLDRGTRPGYPVDD